MAHGLRMIAQAWSCQRPRRPNRSIRGRGLEPVHHSLFLFVSLLSAARCTVRAHGLLLFLAFCVLSLAHERKKRAALQCTRACPAVRVSTWYLVESSACIILCMYRYQYVCILYEYKKGKGQHPSISYIRTACKSTSRFSNEKQFKATRPHALLLAAALMRSDAVCCIKYIASRASCASQMTYEYVAK